MALTNELKLRLDWADMDLFGHINNISYFKFIQSARVEFWEKAGIKATEPSKEGTGPILASVSCDFKLPLHYPGDILVVTTCTSLGNSSFTLEHHIYNSENQLAAKAIDVIVLFNFSTNFKVVLPKELRNSLFPEN